MPRTPAGSTLRSADELAERLTTAKAVLALFGFVVYAVVRIAYGRFYERFGLSPDDLGLGYLELLAQAAVGAVVLLGVFGLLVSVILVVYVETGAHVTEGMRALIAPLSGLCRHGFSTG